MADICHELNHYSKTSAKKKKRKNASYINEQTKKGNSSCYSSYYVTEHEEKKFVVDFRLDEQISSLQGKSVFCFGKGC